MALQGEQSRNIEQLLSCAYLVCGPQGDNDLEQHDDVMLDDEQQREPEHNQQTFVVGDPAEVTSTCSKRIKLHVSFSNSRFAGHRVM